MCRKLAFIVVLLAVTVIIPEHASQAAVIGRGSMAEFAWSPDNHSLAIATAFGIWLYDATSGSFQLLAEESASSLAFNIDGSELYFSTLNALQAIDIQSGERRVISTTAFQISGTGAAAVTTLDETLEVWYLESGDPPVTLSAVAESAPFITRISADGAWVAGAYHDFENMENSQFLDIIFFWDVKQQQTIPLPVYNDRIWNITFSPDSARLGAIMWSGDVYWWDLPTLAERHFTEMRAFGDLAFSPDGTLLVFGTSNGDIRLWNSHDEKMTVLGSHLQLDGLAFSRDGQFLASSGRDGTVKLWDMSTSEAIVTLEPRRQEE
ncbi:MAG TPA: WD40 repeat domain-containing protein [Aggregatilineaceae bacterium]|nr:WD40 repeat domain-containing protein [Aggregatilineaceae bacterium]